MSMIQCPKCKKNVADKLITCPFCGASLSVSDGQNPPRVSPPIGRKPSLPSTTPESRDTRPQSKAPVVTTSTALSEKTESKSTNSAQAGSQPVKPGEKGAPITNDSPCAHDITSGEPNGLESSTGTKDDKKTASSKNASHTTTSESIICDSHSEKDVVKNTSAIVSSTPIEPEAKQNNANATPDSSQVVKTDRTQKKSLFGIGKKAKDRDSDKKPQKPTPPDNAERLGKPLTASKKFFPSNPPKETIDFTEPIKSSSPDNENTSDEDNGYDVNIDGYYDDLLPELARQINRIPQENIIKAVFIIVFLFITCMVILKYM